MRVETQPPSGRPLRWRWPALRLRATAPFEMLIAGSWIALVWWSVADSGSGGGSHAASMGMGSMSGMGSMGAMGSMPGMALSWHGSVSSAPTSGLPMWALMSVAMMLPGALPALSHVASHSYRWRRRRAMTEFATVYLALWVAFGAVALTLVGLVHASAGLELGLALALASVWQLTAFKRRALRDCHLSVPLPPRGRSAVIGAARFGMVNGSACVRSCWPVMLAMTVVPGSRMLVWMPVLTGLMTVEKLTRRPRLAARIVAVVLGLGAVVAVAVT